MVSRFVTLFLILCMGWQSLAFAGVGALVANEDQEQHELLHFQGVAHHHDEHAGDFHADNSTASAVHALSDASQFSPALPTAQSSSPGLTGADRPSVEHLLTRPQLQPDGLERPPKPTA